MKGVQTKIWRIWLSKAKNAFRKLKVWSSKQFNKKTKIKLFNTLVKPVFLYNCYAKG